MTGPEHYRRAEALLDEMTKHPDAVAKGANDGVNILAFMAQAHATLALAAATATGLTDHPGDDWDEWRPAVSRVKRSTD